MKAARVEGGGVVRVAEVEEPTPGPGEVVIETAASAICGSEMKGYRGPGSAKLNDGHEAAGTVAALGPDAGGGSTELAARLSSPKSEVLHLGQRVGVSAVAGCGDCDYCRRGQYTWCRDFRGYANMHAERFVAAARACHPLPDDIPWDVGVLITGDGLGVPYHTSRKIAGPSVGTVAVFGVGPIGLGNAIMQVYLGRRVIAVDVSEERLALAKERGAALALDPKEADPVERVREFTGGEGADVCIEAAGRPETVRQCFAAVRKGGTVVFNGEQPAVELSPSEDFIRRDVTAVGSWFYHFSEYPAMLDLFREGLPVADLVTHRYPLAEAESGFREFAAGRTGKVLLLYG